MTAEEAAAFILDNYWSSGRFPVDPIYLADKLDIGVYTTDELPENVSGAIVKKPHEAPVILLNKYDEHTRRGRFTVAHELGHFMFRENIGKKAFTYVDLRSDMPHTPEEQFANCFAANLLMPAKAIRSRYETGKPLEQNILKLSDCFQVSNEAMCYRLKNLGYD